MSQPSHTDHEHKLTLLSCSQTLYNMIPTKQDRATDDGSEPVVVGGGGALSTGSGASANATEALPATDNGGRAAGSNQQQPEGHFPSESCPSVFSVPSSPAHESCAVEELHKLTCNVRAPSQSRSSPSRLRRRRSRRTERPARREHALSVPLYRPDDAIKQ